MSKMTASEAFVETMVSNGVKDILVLWVLHSWMLWIFLNLQA